MGKDMCLYHYGVIQSTTALKTLCSLPAHPYPFTVFRIKYHSFVLFS